MKQTNSDRDGDSPNSSLTYSVATLYNQTVLINQPESQVDLISSYMAFTLLCLCASITGGPLNVMVDLYVESFGNIKEADMVGASFLPTFLYYIIYSLKTLSIFTYYFQLI